MKKCDICGKELKHNTDWFMVKKPMWKSYCKLMNIEEGSLVCTECFERVMGEIRPEHLDLPNGRIFPINFWILMKYKPKEFIPYIQNEKEYVQFLNENNIRFKGIDHNKLIGACDRLIEELSH